jgi:hypothetical protein
MERTCARCGEPATKCLLPTKGIEGTLWFCEEHYSDPRIRRDLERNWGVEY